MEWLIISLIILVFPTTGHLCPKRCMCQNLSPSLAILCAKTGLLFVPSVIDRRTVELRLTENFITAVRRRDFTNMTSLLHLTLSRNTISQIMPHTFADLKRLRALHLDSNRLNVVTDDYFQGLTNLRHLILANNQLHNISTHAFDDFLGTLEDLDLSYNNLVVIPWETIGRLTNVNTLNMDHNLIEHVPLGVFANLHKLARLDMTSNKLKKIPPDPLFLRIPVYAKSKGLPLTSLVLSFGGNPLHCNCELLWLRRLTREDDLETCATPPDLSAKYFWTIPEEEFICEPPVITKRSFKTYVMEGQPASLKCKANGDPDPDVHWISPEGRLISNTSRTLTFSNGSLEINITSPKDMGVFTCIASNAAGESTGTVALVVTPRPHLANSTNRIQEPDPGPSDILTSAKSGSSYSNDTRTQEKSTILAELTANSALIRWSSQQHFPAVRMFQIQYNSSEDDTLVYRMIPSTNKDFLVRDLAPAREYDLCVLAVYEDGVTALTATRQVGCVSFTTHAEFTQCHVLRSHFLGGTIIIIIGGIIVASVLVFIIILMIRYKVYSQHGPKAGKGFTMSKVRSQSNGGGQVPGQLPCSGSKVLEGQEDHGAGFGAGTRVTPSSLKDCIPMALVLDCEKGMQNSEASSECAVLPIQKRLSRTLEQKAQPSLSTIDGTSSVDGNAAGQQVSDEKTTLPDWGNLKI